MVGMGKVVRLIQLALLFSFLLTPLSAQAMKVCEREMARAAKEHNVPLPVLYAVGLTETGRGDSLRPYALNIEGKSIYDVSKKQAVSLFHEARRQGKKLIDVGCMQINHYYHKKHFEGVGDMLTPSRNVAYAAKFLRRLYRREGSWTMAAARYHAGPKNTVAQKRYVCRVMINMIAVGMGTWTPEAKKFCGK